MRACPSNRQGGVFPLGSDAGRLQPGDQALRARREVVDFRVPLGNCGQQQSQGGSVPIARDARLPLEPARGRLLAASSANRLAGSADHGNRAW